MRELPRDHSENNITLLDPFKQTLRTGYWILTNPLVLVVIAAGVLFDQPIRQLLVVSSQLYARIEIPVLYFGIISAGTAVIGLLAAAPMRRLATSQSPRANFLLLFSTVTLGTFRNCTAYTMVGCRVFYAALIIDATPDVFAEPLSEPIG